MIGRRHVLGILGLAISLISLNASAALNASNGQYSSKLYTEGLGRMPEQAGWRGIENYWAANVCNLASLQNLARGVLTSPEFMSRSPTNREKAFRLYRATLHRDASPSEFNATLSQLNGGTSWATVLNNMLASLAFSQRVSGYCSGTPSGWQPIAPYNQVVTSTGSVTDEATLRSQLASASPGQTVYLEQGAVITLNSQLVIPDGVTLATVGVPGYARGPLLGRLARNGNFNAPLIKMNGGSKLTSVWVDGQRNRFGFLQGGINIFADGTNIDVTNSLISDSPGWTNIQYLRATTACDGGLVADNLITAYGSSHIGSGWTDGISIACKSVIVERNQIIDATDVGIVVFQVYPSVQTTHVRGNYILNVGNSAYGGLVTDPLHPDHLPGVPLSQVLDFTGTLFSDNVIWSSPSVHVDFVISNGTRPWFGANAYTGKGATFYANSSGTETVTTVVGIAVSGMLETMVQSNVFTTRPAPPAFASRCGLRNVVVAPMPYGNDGASSIQPNTVVTLNDPIVAGCIGH